MRKGSSGKITSAQKRWCELTVAGMTGVDAFNQIGWKGRRPDIKTAQWHALKQIRDYKAHLEARATKKAELSIDRVIADLIAVKDRCMAGEGFKPSDAIRALELLGKHLKMWQEKVSHELTGANGGPVQYVVRMPEPVENIDEWLQKSK